MALGSRIIRLAWIGEICLCALVSGCDWQSVERPSLLVIAVDALPVESVVCSEDTETISDSGFAVLCQDSVRFTHAYTTSTLSLPALASLLTGLYPLDHEVRDNGADFLSAKIRTVSEEAQSRSYRTAFWSGGVPVWRKSGLNQGFENFDDTQPPSPRLFYRPVGEVFSEVGDWIESETGKDSFFAVVYLNDLSFPEVATKSLTGELREATSLGQLQNLDEKLFLLIDRLKRAKRFNSTHIVLAGLFGSSKRGSYREQSTLNLFSENTQVALLLKPASKVRDRGIHWKVDAKVSLADIGKTLFRLIGAEPSKGKSEAEFPLVALDAMLTSPNPDWDTERPILLESAWSKWRYNGPIRYGIHWDNIFVVLDQEIKIYNTLIDRTQVLPLSVEEPIFAEYEAKSRGLEEKAKLERWSPTANLFFEKIRIAREAFSKKGDLAYVEKKVAALGDVVRSDRQVQDWLAMWLIQKRNWAQLKNFGDSLGRAELGYLATKNLSSKVSYLPKGCYDLLTQPFNLDQPGTYFRTCPDKLVLRLIAWIRTEKGAEQDRARDLFLKAFTQDYSDRKLAQNNFLRALSWDTRLAGTDFLSHADIILELPEYKSYREIVDRRLRELNQ